MGLDDAIDKARKQPPQQDPKQLEAQWRERDKLRLAELLPDVLRRLTPYSGERIHVVQPSATGEHVGPYGRRFKEIHRQRCWLIKELRRDTPEHRPLMKSPPT